MFGREKKQKDPLKKGCWSRWGSLFISIIFMLVVGGLIALNGFMTGADNLQKYLDLLAEIQNPVSESEIAPNKITAEDKLAFQTLFNDAVHHGDDLPLFDENGNFISENLSDPAQLEFLSALELKDADLACFLNSLLGSGWVPDLYKNGESLVNILQAETSTSASGSTTIAAVAKIAIPKLLAENTSEISEIRELLAGLPEYIYLSFESTFNFEAEDRAPVSTMQINQLSTESNSLFLEFLFGELGDSEGTMDENLNEIINFIFGQLEELSETFGCDVFFAEDSLVLSVFG